MRNRCWLKQSDYLWIFALYAWLVAAFIGNFIIWFFCYWYMKKIVPNASKRPTIFLVLGYTIAFWLVWSFPLAHRIYIVTGHNNPDVLQVLRYGHSTMVPLQGYVQSLTMCKSH